jgi:hypothetical protein
MSAEETLAPRFFLGGMGQKAHEKPVFFPKPAELGFFASFCYHIGLEKEHGVLGRRDRHNF